MKSICQTEKVGLALAEHVGRLNEAKDFVDVVSVFKLIDNHESRGGVRLLEYCLLEGANEYDYNGTNVNFGKVLMSYIQEKCKGADSALGRPPPGVHARAIIGISSKLKRNGIVMKDVQLEDLA